MIPGGGNAQPRILRATRQISDEVGDEMAAIIFDPQTSGGLLIALPEAEALPLLAELQTGGNLEVAVIGRVVEQTGFAIELV